MAKKTGLAQNFYVGGRDLSGDVGSIQSVGGVRSTLEVTGIDKSGVERLLAHGDGQMTFQTFFNDATGQAHDSLSPLTTADVIVLWALGLTIGDIAAFLVAKQINYDFNRPMDGSLEQVTEVQGDGNALEWATMLTAGMITHSSATNGASENNGGSSASGLAGVLQVKSIASGTITLTIEDSPNNSTWSTLKAFASVSSAPTAERVTVSGTVDQYLRIASTGTFGGSCVFAVATRRGESTDDVAYA